MSRGPNQNVANLSDLQGRIEAIVITLQAVIVALDDEIPGAAKRLLNLFEAAQAMATDTSDPVHTRSSSRLGASLHEFIHSVSRRPGSPA